MNIEEFRSVVAECITGKTGDRYTLINNDTVKNNGLILHGLVFRREERVVSPSLYLDDLFDEYEKGKSIDEIAEQLISEEEKAWRGDDFDVDAFTDYDRVKNRLFIKLINTELNEEMLRDIPNRQFLDLSMVVYAKVDDMCGIDGTILIRREHAERWNVCENELIDTAVENTRNNGVRTEDMYDLTQMFLKEMDERLAPNIGGSGRNMLVLSNEKLIFGASAMIFEDVLKKICIENDTSYYIIPSSIHEVILIEKELVSGDVSELNSMIRQVNADALRPDEVLAEHAYFYSVSTGYEAV